MLEIEQALVRFGDRRALDLVDLALLPAETVAVLGPSGSGKTTLLRAVAGLQRLDGGRICWDRADLVAVSPHERRFGFMFQEYALFPHRDVEGNVEFGLRMATTDRAARKARVDEVLELVGLTGLRARRIATLSGGEQQRVALARALAVSPRLLMLDEPLGALDRVWRRRLLTEIRSILDRAALSALYVTHDHEEAFAVAARVAIMREGKVVQVGAPADVWRAPVDAWTAAFLGFGPIVRAEVRDGVVHTPWGPIPARARGAAGWAEIVVRPDGARLDPAGSIDATVLRSTFTGTRVEVEAAAGDGPPVTVVVAAGDAPAVGERIRVSIDPGALLVYPVPAD
ncbi:MAG TPA: ABC transporter ATP-binding protein [Acidimicrobiia bacterium]|jgi:thiamine transport system ATP-binding protein|nr:ABC transporter ATP-binding protein [Acidimicrobiia bacterium]